MCVLSRVLVRADCKDEVKVMNVKALAQGITRHTPLSSHRQFVRSSAATTVAQKSEGKSCPGKRGNFRRCRGKLHDNILDWEDGLPDADLELAISNACVADLSLCLGTTLQIVPTGRLHSLAHQEDRHADLIVNTYVDTLMKRLLEILDIPLLPYSPKHDPLKLTQLLLQESQLLLQTSGIADRSEENAFEPIEWTIPEEWVTDKDLEERVKARKVIRKRSGVKETVIRNTTVHYTLTSLYTANQYLSLETQAVTALLDQGDGVCESQLDPKIGLYEQVLSGRVSASSRMSSALSRLLPAHRPHVLPAA
ncbi:NAD-dependent protein deacetylase Sirt6 [Chionoecetes opilio]|uniref:NAD-dependent protein deacetylase Sirt6 n=1 Tax=Chionoecetes opilio TaxID=41210 RepID=A0A8J4YD85_CHIOP|nr:NAD-dependent protein deacetylase Sirt6 [Chionoecetes opilio]